MLIERDADLALIQGGLEAAGTRRGGTVVFCGEPGVGKSALLQSAVDSTSGAVLSARGLETESELAFMGLRDLLWPVLDEADALPVPQRRALLGALALEDAGTVDPFAVRVATLTLLTSIASSAPPLLVVIDDLQWLDDASVDVLRFIHRRLDEEPVLLLVGAREEPSGFGDGGARVQALSRLSADAVQELVNTSGGWVDPALVAHELYEATGGNPLALTELMAQREVLATAIHNRQPLPVTDVITSSFERRLARLSAAAGSALLLGAASESPGLEAIVGAAARQGLGIDAFVEAEAAGFVALDDGRLHFAHPIMRSVVYARAASPDRRAAHAALAGEAEQRKNEEEAAWHAAAAAILPDEAIAVRLDAAAAAYGRRSGHYAAARAFERAAALSQDSEGRATRLHNAAESARRAGYGGWAQELLDQARDASEDPRVQAEVEFTRTLLLSWQESPRQARQRFEELAASVRETHPDCAALAHAYGASQAIVEGDIATAKRDAEAGLELVDMALTTAETRNVVLQALGTALVLGGERRGADVVREAAEDLDLRGEMTGREYVAGALLWIEEYDLAHRLLAARLDSSRRAGDIRALTASLDVEAARLFRTGEWKRAHEAAEESVRLAAESDQPVQLAYSLATLAIIQAAQGLEGAGATAGRSQALADQHDLAEVSQYLAAALGQWELGRDHYAKSIDHLRRARDYMRSAGQREPAVHQWAADLLDSAMHAGDLELAAETVEELRAQSAVTGRAWGMAVAARGLGMLAGPDDYPTAFAEAIHWHERTTAPFELGRVHLWWGRRLRRDRQRVAARDHLETAAEIFKTLGSQPWVEAALAELRASGARLRPGLAASSDELTPQERQIAALVVGGMSNKEVAGRMYLSPKTVETHLSRIYRKLGVTTRQQLASKVHSGGDDVAGIEIERDED